jgi:putative ABC transport system permease protein
VPTASRARLGCVGPRGRFGWLGHGVETAVGTAETSLGSIYQLAQAVVVDPDGVDRVLDLDVTDGSLAHLGSASIGLSKSQADEAHAQVGDHVEVALGDGARRDVRVAAVYERGLGFGDAVLPTALAARHVTDPMLSSVLVRTSPGAAPDAVASRLERLAVRYPVSPSAIGMSTRPAWMRTARPTTGSSASSP